MIFGTSVADILIIAAAIYSVLVFIVNVFKGTTCYGCPLKNQCKQRKNSINN